MKKVDGVEFKYSERKRFHISKTNQCANQREKLEQAIANLCNALGIDLIEYILDSSANNRYYIVPGAMGFQSATNLIVDLSFKLAELNYDRGAK